MTSEEIKYPAYRAFLDDRQYTNDSIMGLLVGSKLASHVLKITEGSDRTLPEIFPNVDKIKRFNLKTAFAQDVLENSEAHLGAMAVPHLLGSHEDYGKSCLKILHRAGLISSTKLSKASSANVHSFFQEATAIDLSPSSIEIYELLRKMRNCVIHASGAADKGTEEAAQNLSPESRESWEGMCNEAPPRCALGSKVSFLYPEMILSLAILKRISREMNEALRRAVDRNIWLEIFVEDFEENTKPRTSTKTLMRAARGFSEHNYKSLKFTEEEIMSAIIKK